VKQEDDTVLKDGKTSTKHQTRQRSGGNHHFDKLVPSQLSNSARYNHNSDTCTTTTTTTAATTAPAGNPDVSTKTPQPSLPLRLPNKATYALERFESYRKDAPGQYSVA
jgi:hypothetical protein